MLQKQSDGSFIQVPDKNTRQLPPEVFKSITVNDIQKDPAAYQQYLSSTAGGGQQAPTQQAPTGIGMPGNPTGSSDPVTTFNLAILDMLKTAQGGAGNVDLFKQQRALQRTAIDRTSQITPEDLRVLSPGQQSAIRSGSVQALEPEIDAVASEIKARDSRLAHFESTLGQMREIGLDIAKNIAPPKEVVEGYKNMLRMGGDISSIPVEIRNKVLAGLTPEDWTTFETSQTNKGLVMDLIQRYPDSGIQPTDTLQAAQAKISKSKIYQDQVRGPVGSGGGGSIPVDTDIENYAQAVYNGSLNLNGVPQKLRGSVSARVEELKKNSSAKYDTEFEARVDYDRDIRQLETDIRNNEQLPPPSEIIKVLVNDYGSKVSSQEITSTIYNLFGVNTNNNQAPAPKSSLPAKGTSTRLVAPGVIARF